MSSTEPASAPARLRLRKANELRILAFGDSLTEGYTNFGMTFHPYGDALEASLKKLLPTLTKPAGSVLPRLTKVSVDVEGQSGDCVLSSLRGEFSRRLRDAAPAGVDKYDLVIILGGTNDLAYKMSNDLAGAEEIFESGLKVLYEYVLGKTEASLVVVTVPERAIDTRSSDVAKRARASREHLNDLMKKWVDQQDRKDGERVFLMDLAPLIPFPQEVGEDEETDETIWSADGLHMSEGGYDHTGELLAKLIHGLL